MKIKKVTVFGTGNLGTRLAFNIAFNKIDVTVFDESNGLLEEARTRFRELSGNYQKNYRASREQTEAALANIAYSTDIHEAAGNAQLIIEAIVEDFRIKKNFYRELRKSAPKNAILVTTSKDLHFESLAKASGSPHKFISLHFSDNRDFRHYVEIMVLPETQKEVLLTVADFWESIGMEVDFKHLKQQE